MAGRDDPEIRALAGSPPGERLDLEATLDLAVAIATSAGRLLEDGLRADRLAVQTKSSRTDMVSNVDRKTEEHIVASILGTRPDDSILAEEGSARSGSTGVRWVIDPLDGTTNYLYRLPVFSVSIAVEVDDLTVLGVVHDPSRSETFTAIRGAGAWCNGVPISIRPCSDLSTALVATGFAYTSSGRELQARVLTRVLPAVRDIRRAGSAALDLCWVAAGRLDAYFESGTSPWDRAAGAIVAAEAGAWVGGLDGHPASDDLVIAAPPALADPLTRLLSDSQPDEP